LREIFNKAQGGIMKTALNPNTIQKTDFETQIDVCSKAGYEGFELMYDVIQEYLQKGHSLNEVKKMLVDKNIKAAVVCAAGALIQIEQGRLRSEALDSVKKSSEYCNLFGCGIVTVCSPLKQTNIEQAAEDLASLCEIAQSYKVKICYEPLGFSQKFKDIKTTLELFKKVNYFNCGILLDPFHLYRGGSILDDIDLIPPERILMAHFDDVLDVPVEKMRDLDRVFPGEGVLELNKYVRKLKEKNYQGYLSLEIFNEDYWADDPYRIAKRGKELLEQYMEGKR